MKIEKMTKKAVELALAEKKISADLRIGGKEEKRDIEKKDNRHEMWQYR